MLRYTVPDVSRQNADNARPPASQVCNEDPLRDTPFRPRAVDVKRALFFQR